MGNKLKKTTPSRQTSRSTASWKSEKFNRLQSELELDVAAGADLGEGCRGWTPSPPLDSDDLLLSETSSMLQKRKTWHDVKLIS